MSREEELQAIADAEARGKIKRISLDEALRHDSEREDRIANRRMLRLGRWYTRLAQGHTPTAQSDLELT